MRRTRGKARFKTGFNPKNARILAMGGNMIEIQAQATPQKAKKSYTALMAKTYWLQAKRFVEAPFLVRTSSTRNENRNKVSDAYGERGDACEAQGEHLKAAALYAKAVKCHSAGGTEKYLGLLEKQAASLDEAEKSCSRLVPTLGGKGSEFDPILVAVADSYFDAAELRAGAANSFLEIKNYEKAKASLAAAISDYGMAEELAEGLHNKHPKNRHFSADIAKKKQERAKAALLELS